MLPRTYKRKTNNGLVPLSVYNDAAKRVFENGESYRKVAKDFGVRNCAVDARCVCFHKIYINCRLIKSKYDCTIRRVLSLKIRL